MGRLEGRPSGAKRGDGLIRAGYEVLRYRAARLYFLFAKEERNGLVADPARHKPRVIRAARVAARSAGPDGCGAIALGGQFIHRTVRGAITVDEVLRRSGAHIEGRRVDRLEAAIGGNGRDAQRGDRVLERHALELAPVVAVHGASGKESTEEIE